MESSLIGHKASSLSRRSLLAQMSLMSVGVAACASSGTSSAVSAAAATESEYYSPASLPHDLPPEAGTLPRATFAHPDKFDLENPKHLKLARLKMLNALDGSTTYFYTMTRHFMCPEGKPPYPIFAEMELTTMWLERRDGMSEDEAIIRAMFTRAPLHPLTFKPITSIFNPHVGREMPLKYTLFAGGGYELSLADDTKFDPITQADEPHYRIGDDIAFIMYDPRQGDGPFHPRMDTVTWRTNYEKLMSKSVPLVEADHVYTSIMKASVYDLWSGVPDGDPTQVVSSKVGKKVGSLEALPKECHEYLINRFPDRV